MVRRHRAFHILCPFLFFFFCKAQGEKESFASNSSVYEPPSVKSEELIRTMGVQYMSPLLSCHNVSYLPSIHRH